MSGIDMDTERMARLASLANENAAALLRHAPQSAADLLWLSGFLQGHVATAPLLAPPPERKPRCRLLLPAEKRTAEERAATAMLDLAEAWPADQPPPSMRKTWLRMKTLGIPRRIIATAYAKQWPLS